MSYTLSVRKTQTGADFYKVHSNPENAICRGTGGWKVLQIGGVELKTIAREKNDVIRSAYLKKTYGI